MSCTRYAKRAMYVFYNVTKHCEFEATVFQAILYIVFELTMRFELCPNHAVKVQTEISIKNDF